MVEQIFQNRGKSQSEKVNFHFLTGIMNCIRFSLGENESEELYKI